MANNFADDDMEVMQIVSKIEWYCLRVSMDEIIFGLAEKLEKVKELKE